MSLILLDFMTLLGIMGCDMKVILRGVSEPTQMAHDFQSRLISSKVCLFPATESRPSRPFSQA